MNTKRKASKLLHVLCQIKLSYIECTVVPLSKDIDIISRCFHCLFAFLNETKYWNILS